MLGRYAIKAVNEAFEFAVVVIDVLNVIDTLDSFCLGEFDLFKGVFSNKTTIGRTVIRAKNRAIGNMVSKNSSNDLARRLSKSCNEST